MNLREHGIRRGLGRHGAISTLVFQGQVCRMFPLN